MGFYVSPCNAESSGCPAVPGVSTWQPSLAAQLPTRGVARAHVRVCVSRASG